MISFNLRIIPDLACICVLHSLGMVDYLQWFRHLESIIITWYGWLLACHDQHINLIQPVTMLE